MDKGIVSVGKVQGRLRALPWLLAATLAVGCASTSPQNQQIKDSLEPVNRPVFNANKQIDDYAFGPLARGWKAITPSLMRTSISNAARNLTFPQRFISSLGQANFEGAGTELGRFLVNTTVGIGGLFDPATRFGLEKHDDDLGRMLASWHVPPGPYLVIPILGPSTARDAFGDLFSIALNPLVWTGVTIPPVGVLFAVNKRAESDDQIRAAQNAALDYYVFARDAYIQQRTSVIRGEYVTQPQEGEIPPDLYEVPQVVDDALPAPGPCEATPVPDSVADGERPPPC